MINHSRQYSEQDVSDIVRRALYGNADGGLVSHEELVEIAAESGVTREALERAIREREESREIEEARETWKARQRFQFYAHLRSYMIVNAGLFLINIMSSRGYLWFVWVVVGWGFFIAFDAANTFFVSEQRSERGAAKIVRRRAKLAKSE